MANNMIFNLKNKGTITQKFLQNLNPLYASQGLAGHTGVDHTKGYGKPVIFDNDGYIYKIIREGDLASNWVGVYQIVDDEMEICYGHLSRVDVQEGQFVKAGDQVGLEGNKGDVFVGQTRITPEMQRNGDKRGSHSHESWRPVRRTPSDNGAHYLRDRKGRIYEKSGRAYEIVYDTPQTRGQVDPLLYAKQSVPDTKISLQKQIIVVAYKLLSLLKK